MSLEFPVYTRNGLTIVGGKGYRVTDSNGREYLDFYGGHAVAILGHANPEVTQAITEQASTLTFQTNVVDVPIRETACEQLVSIAPPGMDRVFLVNSGAEANENALRVAFTATGRSKAVALKNGFHGRSAAASAVTDHASWYAFPRKPFDVEWVAPNSVDELEKALDKDTACFIFEPVQGMAGAVALNETFLQAARAFCTERGILMIADEVQSGMGRSGTFFAVQGMHVAPDMATLAKGIGGGFPAAALLASASLADSIKKGWLGTTFGGGPVACAAIVATVNAMKRADFLPNVVAMSDKLKREAQIGPVTAIQGKGLLLGLRTSRPAKDVVADLQARGILAGGASDPNIVRLLPPLIIDHEAVDGLVAALRDIPS